MTDDAGQQSGEDPIGSAAEEAAKLFAAMREWAGDRAHVRVGENLDTGAPECAYCPICRTVHVLREAGPEVGTHLATAAAALAQAAASVMEAAAAPQRQDDTTQDGPVEKIDLDDDAAEDGTDMWEDED